MNGAAFAVNAMKGAFGATVCVELVVAVVAKAFARAEGGCFANDAVAFDDVALAVDGVDYPAASVECNGTVGKVGDGDEVDEGVGRFTGGHVGVEKIDQTV